MQIAQKRTNDSEGPIERGSYLCPDFDSYLETLQASWATDDFQLSAGRLNARFDFAASANATVYELQLAASLKAGGALKSDFIAFAAPAVSGMTGRWWGSAFPEGSMPFVRGGDEIDLIFRAGHRHTLTLIHENRFRRIYETITGRSPDFLDSRDHFLRLEPGRLEQLRRRFNSLRTIDRHTDAKQWESDLVEAVADAIEEPNIFPLSQSHSRALVRRATEIAENSDYQLSILELCDSLRVSKRTLENAFREQVGVSPAACFRVIRLNRCHRMLVEANPKRENVTEIAMACGFQELGRFAGTYHRFFGEYPSQSLRRNRGKGEATESYPDPMGESFSRTHRS